MGENGQLQAVVAGHICLDITPGFGDEKRDIKELLSPGKLINVSGVNLSTGGAVSNTGIALSILGVNTQLMGKVGNDYLGKIILEILRGRGVDKAMTIVDGARTSYSIVIAPPNIDRIFMHDPGANNTFGPEDVNYEIVKKAKLFHLGYPPAMERMYKNEGKELMEIYERVKDLGVTTSLDMCLPDPSAESGRADWESILKKVLPFVDIYIPSIEETLYMVKKDEYKRLNSIAHGGDILDVIDMNILQEIGDKLISFGAKIVVIKCGKKGYYVRTQSRRVLEQIGRASPGDLSNWGDRELIEEVFHVPNVVSATGAGDTSIAGFLAAYLKGYTIEEAIKIACATGANCVRTFDAVSGIKPIEDTLDIIKKGWKKERISIRGDYWTYDSGLEVWKGRKDAGN